MRKKGKRPRTDYKFDAPDGTCFVSLKAAFSYIEATDIPRAFVKKAEQDSSRFSRAWWSKQTTFKKEP
jgi:hypothetical protein